jgi:hypothetical protein
MNVDNKRRFARHPKHPQNAHNLFVREFWLLCKNSLVVIISTLEILMTRSMTTFSIINLFGLNLKKNLIIKK